MMTLIECMNRIESVARAAGAGACPRSGHKDEDLEARFYAFLAGLRTCVASVHVCQDLCHERPVRVIVRVTVDIHVAPSKVDTLDASRYALAVMRASQLAAEAETIINRRSWDPEELEGEKE